MLTPTKIGLFALFLTFPLFAMEKDPTIKKPKIPEHKLVFTQCDGGCPHVKWDQEIFPGQERNNKYQRQIFVHKKGTHIGLINFGVATRYKDEGRNPCFISRLDVHPEFQHQGIGTQLLHRAIEIITQQHQCSVIEWLATPSSSAPFYKKLGADTQSTLRVKYDRLNNGPIIKRPSPTKIEQLHKAKNYFPE